MNPKVSVIVPVYNVEKYLDRCMESLLRQTLDEIEIILVDDGSLDACPQKCDQYASGNNKIRVVHKRNAGLGMARNSGIDIARGDYIAFLDSDDFVDISIYQTLYDKAAETHADMVCCDFFFYSASGKRVPIYAYSENRDWEKNNARTEVLLDMLGAMPECHSDVIYQMSVWKAIYSRNLLMEHHIRFPSERELIAEDIVFHTAFFPYVNKVSYIRKALYYYCENSSSLTKTYKEDRYKREIKLYKYLDQTLSNYPISFDYKLRLQRTFIGRIRVCMKDCFLNSTGALKNGKKILSDEHIQRVLREYDYSNMYFPYRIFVLFAMKNWLTGLRIYFKLIAIWKK